MRVGGTLQDVDTVRIKAEADAGRAAYYAEWLDYPIFKIDPPFGPTSRGRRRERRAGDGRRLEHLCGDAIADARLSELFATRGATATQFADALFEKGVLSRGPHRNEWSVAIPSMAVLGRRRAGHRRRNYSNGTRHRVVDGPARPEVRAVGPKRQSDRGTRSNQ